MKRRISPWLERFLSWLVVPGLGGLIAAYLFVAAGHLLSDPAKQMAAWKDAWERQAIADRSALSAAQERIDALTPRPTAPLPTPKQFYSEIDKNRIADALEALNGTLTSFVSRIDSTKGGVGAVNSFGLSDTIVGANKRAFFEHKPPPTATEVTEMVSGAADRAIKSAGALRDLMKELDTTIEGAKAPVRIFDGKMQDILQRTEAMKLTSAVIGKADTCAYHVKVAQRYINKYSADTALFFELLGTACFQDLEAAINDLKQWIDQTKRRAAAARQEL